MRFVFVVVLLVCVTPDSSWAKEPQTDSLSQDDWLDRDTVIGDVIERNPTLEAGRQAWAAAREREPQVASLEDPIVSYAFAPISIGGGGAGYGQTAFIAQRLPYPGKLGLRGEIARAEAEAAGYDYQTLRLRLATAASLLFDDYYVVARALEINSEHIDLLKDFQRVATARYAAGLAAQQDPLQAEVVVAELLHHDVVLRTRERTIVAQLNALLHRPPGASLPPPPSELAIPPAEDVDDDAPVGARPEMKGQIATIEAREADVRLREKDFYPDFEATTTFNSMWAESSFRWMVGVSVNLPVHHDRLRAASAEAAAALERSRSEKAALEDTIRTEVYVARERLREARHIVELYRDRLLPASADQVGAARAGFETGQNSFLALIEAERNQRDVELGYEEALADWYRRRAELDRALGRIPFLSGGAK